MVRRRFELELLTASAAALLAASTVAVRMSGLAPVLPGNLLAFIVLVGLPFAFCFHYFSQRERVFGAALSWPVCVATAGALLLGWHYVIVWPLVALVLFTVPAIGYRIARVRAVGCATVTLVGGYGFVWNVNYLLVRLLPVGRFDPLMRSTDLWVYRPWFGPAVDLTGRFPLVHNAVLLRAFDNAYGVLIPEVITVAFLLTQTGDSERLRLFLKRLFGFYLVGILIYLVFPVNGPHLYFPSQQDLARSLPGTVLLAEGMLHDYHAAQSGGPLQGFGYFIAMPSLHVLVALFLQDCLSPFRTLFRVFLPVNVVLCLSTVVLGYHYVLDVVAAIVIYLVFVATAGYFRSVPSSALGRTT